MRESLSAVRCVLISLFHFMASRVAGKNCVVMAWMAVCCVGRALSHIMEQGGTPSCPNVGKKFDGWRIACPPDGAPRYPRHLIKVPR